MQRLMCKWGTISQAVAEDAFCFLTSGGSYPLDMFGKWKNNEKHMVQNSSNSNLPCTKAAN